MLQTPRVHISTALFTLTPRFEARYIAVWFGLSCTVYRPVCVEGALPFSGESHARCGPVQFSSHPVSTGLHGADEPKVSSLRCGTVFGKPPRFAPHRGRVPPGEDCYATFDMLSAPDQRLPAHSIRWRQRCRMLLEPPRAHCRGLDKVGRGRRRICTSNTLQWSQKLGRRFGWTRRCKIANLGSVWREL